MFTPNSTRAGFAAMILILASAACSGGGAEDAAEDAAEELGAEFLELLQNAPNADRDREVLDVLNSPLLSETARLKLFAIAGAGVTNSSLKTLCSTELVDGKVVVELNTADNGNDPCTDPERFVRTYTYELSDNGTEVVDLEYSKNQAGEEPTVAEFFEIEFGGKAGPYQYLNAIVDQNRVRNPGVPNGKIVIENAVGYTFPTQEDCFITFAITNRFLGVLNFYSLGEWATVDSAGEARQTSGPRSVEIQPGLTAIVAGTADDSCEYIRGFQSDSFFNTVNGDYLYLGDVDFWQEGVSWASR